MISLSKLTSPVFYFRDMLRVVNSWQVVVLKCSPSTVDVSLISQLYLQRAWLWIPPTLFFLVSWNQGRQTHYIASAFSLCAHFRAALHYQIHSTVIIGNLPIKFHTAFSLSPCIQAGWHVACTHLHTRRLLMLTSRWCLNDRQLT